MNSDNENTTTPEQPRNELPGVAQQPKVVQQPGVTQQPSPDRQASQQATAPENRELVLKIARELERERLTGVGGWLICFIVLYAFSLLALGFDFFMSATEPASSYSMYVYEQQSSPIWRVCDFLKIGLIIAMYVGMAKHKKATPLICKLLLILEFMVGNLYLMLDPDMIMDELASSIRHGTAAGLYFIFSLIYAVGWYVYFCRSKRVKYTFVK